MDQEARIGSNSRQDMKQILSEFLASVIKLEQLAEVGNRYLTSFRQGLEFLRRPSIYETSEMVQSILKENETTRVKSYVEAGCSNVYDSKLSVIQTNTSLSRLQSHIIEAKSILHELETLVKKAGDLLQATPAYPSDPTVQEFSENLENESISERKEISLHNAVSLNAPECASFMAVIYSMVKQDYLMRERVVSSLGLMISSEELDSYCLMWSLRPFISDDIIHEAIRTVK